MLVWTKLSINLLFLRAILTLYVVHGLESFDFKTLSYISNSPWFVRNDAIRRRFQIFSLDEFVRSFAIKLFNLGPNSTYTHVLRFNTDDGLPPTKRKRPRAFIDDSP